MACIRVCMISTTAIDDAYILVLSIISVLYLTFSLLFSIQLLWPNHAQLVR